MRVNKRKEHIKNVIMKDGAVSLKFVGITVVSCYISPNVSMNDYEKRVENVCSLMEDAARTTMNVLMMGDVNAKSYH